MPVLSTPLDFMEDEPVYRSELKTHRIRVIATDDMAFSPKEINLFPRHFSPDFPRGATCDLLQLFQRAQVCWRLQFPFLPAAVFKAFRPRHPIAREWLASTLRGATTLLAFPP